MSEPAYVDTDLTRWSEDFIERYRAAGYWKGEPLDQMLRDSAWQQGARTALVCGERRWSYRELDARVDQLVAGLLDQGIGAGDKVVLQLPNIAEYVLSFFALFRIGAVPVFALPAHRFSEISYFCAFSEARALIIADRHGGFDFRRMAREVQAAVPGLEKVLVVGEAEEFIPLAALLETPARSCPQPAADQLAFLQLSGGTTGRSKLIPRTHDDYFYSVRASAEICGLTPESVFLCALPAAHNYPMSSPGILGIFHVGGTVVLAPDGSPDTCFALIERERVSLTALVPSLALAWLEAAPGCNRDLSSLELMLVGGSKLNEEAARRIAPTLGCQLQQVFGMAEGLVNYTRLDDPDELVLGTQGRPISPDDEVRIVDDEDRDLPVGASGHLITRGPYTIRGYYRAAQHNARSFTADGFYRTGDIARLLPSGHLVVEGRDKDQINRGGDKISAEEVENHLLAHPAVLDVAVVAMPDAYLGERSCAFIVARGEQPPRSVEINRFMRERGVAQYKIPDRLEFVDQLPKTKVGKVDKRALRERLQPAGIAEPRVAHA